MKSTRIRIAAHLVAAAATCSLANAQPRIYDVNGTLVATPAGQNNGLLSAYLDLGDAVVLVNFDRENSSNTLRWFGDDDSTLYFRSSDCSGPALITSADAIGTTPAALIVERKHAWLHVAESIDGLGVVAVNSIVQVHKECQVFHNIETVWKARPAIDLYTMFTPPFSLH